ncbi:MAG: hypothetical protein II820_10365 [Ruminiclostridium sp.]|nr:hypothetical protein [Ruminiclostridium sp.]
MNIKHEKAIMTAAALCGSAVVFSVPASAYIDPATTSYIIQIVVGVVIACGTAAGIIFNKMKRKLKKKDDGTNTAETVSSGTGKGGVMTAADLLDDENADENADNGNSEE